jgi:predicted metal-dependent enzyme (double-stranded beta helix superfamily)
MSATQRLPVFEKFIQDLRAAWEELPDAEARMKKGQKLLEALVKDPTLREASKKWPSTEGRKNLLFYEDPDYAFAINGVVRVPGRKRQYSRSRSFMDSLRPARGNREPGALPAAR